VPYLAPNQYTEEWPQRVRQTVENLKWWHGRGLGGQELTPCPGHCCTCETIAKLERFLARPVAHSDGFRDVPGPVPANVVPAGDSPALLDRLPFYSGGTVTEIDPANIIDCPECGGYGCWVGSDESIITCPTCHGGGMIDKTAYD
jgi:hypothetical protein